MNKTESLDILNKYINALKERSETEERLSKIDDGSRSIVRDAAFEEYPFGKLLVTFIIVFAVLGVIIRMVISSNLSYKSELPVTVAIFAGCTVLAFAAAKIEHVLINRARSKKNKELVKAVNIIGISEADRCREIINLDNRKIAEAESAIPLSCHGSMAAKQARKLIMSGKAETIEEAAGGYTSEDWEWAYKAEPKFYSDSEQVTFGALALTEATRTVLPTEPQKRFSLEGNTVSNWKMAFVSLTDGEIIGDGDYFQTLSGIERYILDSNQDSILVRGLTLKELERLKK